MKNYTVSLTGNIEGKCPHCNSTKYSFSRPIINKGEIILDCICKNCEKGFSIIYKSYQINYTP